MDNKLYESYLAGNNVDIDDIFINEELLTEAKIIDIVKVSVRKAGEVAKKITKLVIPVALVYGLLNVLADKTVQANKLAKTNNDLISRLEKIEHRQILMRRLKASTKPTTKEVDTLSKAFNLDKGSVKTFSEKLMPIMAKEFIF